MAPPSLAIVVDDERAASIGRQSSLDEDTSELLSHLRAVEATEGSPTRRRSWTVESLLSSAASPHAAATDGAAPDDAVQEVLETADAAGLPRLLPEGDRAALIERLRTDLFEAARDIDF